MRQTPQSIGMLHSNYHTQLSVVLTGSVPSKNNPLHESTSAKKLFFGAGLFIS
jgi:hypothetical protein